MTREEARKAAEVMMAYAEGKEIEFKIKGEDRWETWDGRDTLGFEFDDFDYRIKPEPTYRPFKDKEECWQEMQKHQPFGWVKNMLGSYMLLQVISANGCVDINGYKSSFEEALKASFADGTPFGVKE